MIAAVGLVLCVWPTAAGAGTPTVGVVTNPTYGQILVDAQGKALYTYAGDSGSVATCTGSCAAVWPPLVVPAGTAATAGPGVTGTVGIALQPDGHDQVTYDGAPLYDYVGDAAPGQVTGNGVGGFSVVNVAGAPAPTSSTAPSAVSTTPSSSTAPSTMPASTAAPQSTAASSGSTTGPTPAPMSATSDTLAATGVGGALLSTAFVGGALVVTGILLLEAVRRRHAPRRL
jgi:predicted lipoprotein with Yx(FWY)xxD motif